MIVFWGWAMGLPWDDAHIVIKAFVDLGNGHGHGQWGGVPWARIASLHIAMHCFGGYLLPHHYQQALVLLIDDTVVL